MQNFVQKSHYTQKHEAVAQENLQFAETMVSSKKKFYIFCENFLYATILLYFRISFAREKYENFHFSLRSVLRKNSCISRNVSFAGNPSIYIYIYSIFHNKIIDINKLTALPHSRNPGFKTGFYNEYPVLTFLLKTKQEDHIYKCRN